jgi:hypothetical protein
MSDIATPRPTPTNFDARMTLALLVTICLEAIAGLLWVGAAAQRLNVLEASMSAQQPITERMARIEAQMVGVRATLDRIENRIDTGRAP